MIVDLNKEYEERLVKAASVLKDLRDEHPVGSKQWFRLGGKIDGVQLALSYFREYQRMNR